MHSPDLGERSRIMISDHPCPDFSGLCRRPVLHCELVGGGRDGRVYRVECADGTLYAVKQHFQDPRARRDRMKTELLGLQFLAARRESGVPAVLAMDRERGALLLSHVAGGPVIQPDAAAADQAADFLGRLWRYSRIIEDGWEWLALKPAPDVYFSASGVMGGVRDRLSRLRRVPPSALLGEELAAFVEERLVPALDVWKQHCADRLDAAGVDFGAEIPRASQLLCSTDFGFRNAIRAESGKIHFVDFECFGWNDPARVLCDFALQPDRGLPVELLGRFLDRCRAHFAAGPVLDARCRALFPLFGLKWCCLLLKAFLPGDDDRRSRALDVVIDPRERRAARLAAAGALLDSLPARLERIEALLS